MKTLMILGDKASELLVDGLNQRMVRELVFSEYAIAELSRKLSIPPLKTWRRIRKLVEAKLVEVARVDVIKNLEKKVYRATATNFVSRQFFDLKPRDERLGRAFKTYLEIQAQLMSKMSAFSDIPKGADPIDFSVYAYVKSSCQLFLDPSLREKLSRLEREISEFEKAEGYPPILRQP
jgi:DNA-binding Lrp family transcriptional regulator